nr:sigma-70 family RNA polymerase sigma factor [Fodinicola acaciae]
MDFEAEVEPYRRELLAHCYRMLGSVADAEDLVQETYLRAWKAYERFEGRSSVRTWLYRIATNACLTALRSRERRVLPSGLGGPADDPYATPEPADASWLEPMPDALVEDPAAIVATRDSMRLALIASLQYLPPRQRAVLLLRDVLAIPAAEVAVMLDMTVAAVKSALQRARSSLEEASPERVVEPSDASARALLATYMEAFEKADPATLEKALRADLVLEVTPSRTWFAGMSVCMPYFTDRVLLSPDACRMLPVRANGQPAAAAYYLGPDGLRHAYGIAVLTVSPDGISRITVFGDAALFAHFGLPAIYPGR